MPELPEVETVRRVLERSLTGKNVKSIDIRYNPIISGDTDEFVKKVCGKTITGMDRYGKYLIFELSEGYMLSHLRMEGKYFYVPEGSLDNKHIHVVFHLDDGMMLCYQDVRKFGRIAYLEGDIYHQEPLCSMGYDLVKTEPDLNQVYSEIKKRSIPIKAILLDQSVVSGLGNIYVDEVLYSAHVSPKRKGSRILKREVSDILKESKRILSLAIENKGTTIRSYTSSLGVEGEYQNFLQVHTKTHCPNCKSELVRVKIEGRMTYYCAKCQR